MQNSLRGVRVSAADAPFAVEKGVRAKMDDGTHLEILPFNLQHSIANTPADHFTSKL